VICAKSAFVLARRLAFLTGGPARAVADTVKVWVAVTSSVVIMTSTVVEVTLRVSVSVVVLTEVSVAVKPWYVVTVGVE